MAQEILTENDKEKRTISLFKYLKIEYWFWEKNWIKKIKGDGTRNFKLL